VFDRSEELDTGGFHALTDAGFVVNHEPDYRSRTEEFVVDVPLTVDVNPGPVAESETDRRPVDMEHIESPK
jgi:hypothetical protein